MWVLVGTASTRQIGHVLLAIQRSGTIQFRRRLGGRINGLDPPQITAGLRILFNERPFGTLVGHLSLPHVFKETCSLRSRRTPFTLS